jgi:enamine deaminase RidA (YjgF/YER057c/UK114 family)
MQRFCVQSGDEFEERYGYSRLIGVGQHLFVSGTTARESDLALDTYGQMKSALDIIRQALREADADFADVVRTVVYITNVADIEAVARAHREAFGEIRPAATLIRVLGLVPSEACVEIEVTAVRAGL